MNSLLENMISTKEASEFSGYNSDYLGRLCRSNKIIGTQVGRTWLISKDSLELFIKEQAAHKEDLHASLKATREKEYQYHIQKKQDAASTQDSSVLSPLSSTFSPLYLEKLTEKANSSAFKNKGIAAIAAMGVLLCGIYGAQAAQNASFSKDAASAVLGISSAVRGVYSPSPANSGSVVLSPNVIPDTFAQLVSPAIAPIAFSVSNPVTTISAPENPSDVAYASSKVSFLETRPIVFLAENVASYELGAARSPRVAAVALAGLEVHTYIGTGAAVYESITGGLNAYVQGIKFSGAETLALGTAIQNADEKFPLALASSEIQLPHAWSRLSQDILEGYSKSVYAWVDETPVLPVTILGVEYAIGTKIANATVVVPEALAEGYPSSNYLAAAAIPENYTLGQSVAIATYTTLHNWFGGIAQQVALLFNPSAASNHTALQIFPTYVVTGHSATTTATNTISVPATPAIIASNSGSYSSSYEPPTRTVVEQNVVQGVTQSYVDSAINNLHDFLIKQIEAATRVENDGSSNGGSTVIVVSTSSPTGSITGTSLNVSGDTALTGNLSAATTTLNGPVTINGDVTINGNLFGGNIAGGASGTNVGPNFIATSTTATSTFYGSVNIDNGGLSYSTTTRTTTIANAVVANATSTNLFAGFFQSTNGVFVSLAAQIANFTNLFATNATTTNATSTNLYATNSIFGNLLATIANFTSAFIANLTATNAVFTNATSTNATSTNFFATNALFTSATTTNFGVTNLTTTNFISATGSLGSLAVAGNSSLANFSFMNATGTSLNLATLTATGNATVGGLSVGNLNGFLKATAGAISTSLISLTSDVSNILPIQNGGTGTSSFSTNGVVYGNGTANLLTTAQGGTNSVLVANNGAPEFSSAITVGTSITSPTIDATGSIQLNGADINSAGTLSNVSYTNQSNSYTRPQSFTDYSGVDSTTTNATTTNLSAANLSISNYFSIGSLSGILKAVNGAVTTAIAGTDYQAPGNYLTGLTGDITASGPGSAVATLVTVNTNTGSFGAASTIPTFTVNGKGLITGVSTTTVVAPAGTLTGNALASNVLSSSLTSVGTLANLTVSGTTTIGNIVNNGIAANTLIYANGINQESSAAVSAPLSFTNGTLSLGTVGTANGGTGITSYAAGSLLYANNFGVLTQLPIGTNGQVLEIAGGVPGWGTGISGGGGGGGGIFATSSNLIYPINTSNTLIVGSNAQSDINSLFEVHGTSYFSGDIGIGTTTPNVLLDVAGSNEVAAFGDGNSGATYIGFGASGASNKGAGYIGYNGLSGNTVVQGASGHGIEFDVNNSTFAAGNAMNISSSGQVGIGTTTPGSLLSIQGIANFTAATSTFSSTGGINLNNGCFAINGACLGNGTGTVGSSALAGQFPYYAGTGTTLTATSSLYISPSGNIGVGTTSPGTNLAVEGNGLFSGNLNVANLTATGTASVGNATSTSLYTSLIGLGSSYFSSLTGNGLTNLNGALSISSSSLASGFFQQGGNAFGGAAVLGTTNANPLTFVTNGLEVGRFSANGNFGIKNTNPSYPLDIGSTGLIGQFGDTSANDYISVAGGSSYFGYDSLLQNAAIQAPSGEGIEFNVNNSTFSLGTAAVISSAGNFGIGTTTPGSLLSIQGIANFTAATSTFSSAGGINLTGGCFSIRGGACLGNGTGTVGSSVLAGQFPYYAGTGTTLTATSSLYISPSGNIGVGTTSPSYQLDVNGIARASIYDEGGEVFNVKAYGAKGNGTTNDTAAIQAAINAASAAGGGTVYFPQGTYITGTLTLYSYVHLLGAGEDITILQLASGTNAAVIQTYGFASLTGTNPTCNIVNACGPTDFSIEELSVNGGRYSGNTSSTGIQIYGAHYDMDNVQVYWAAGDGIYSEWSSYGGSPNTPHGFDAGMEAHLTGVYVYGNNGDGVDWKGPHDSMMTNMIFVGSANAGLYVGSNGGGLQVTNAHSWSSQTYAFYLGSTAYLTNIQAEGATTSQIQVNTSNSSIVQATIYACSAGVNGIALGDSTHFPYDTTVTSTRLSDCGVNFTYDGGNSDINVTYNAHDSVLNATGLNTSTGPGTSTSTPPSTDTVEINAANDPGASALGLAVNQTAISNYASTTASNWLGSNNVQVYNLLSTNTYSGFGEVQGNNISSPVVWMYNPGGMTNAFSVRSVGYGSTLAQSPDLFSVFSNGYVGIGTTTPGSMLSVNGSALFNGGITANSLNIVGGSLGLGTTSPSIAGGSNGLAIDGTSAILGVYSSSNDRAIILAPGGGSLDAVGTNLNINRFSGNNVSIGSSAATGDLSIGQVASNFARFYVAGTANASLPLEIFSTSTPTSTTTVAEIDQNGNALFGLGGASVGIGTTTPGSLLSIQGIANFTAATSTFSSAGGINLTGGCFSIRGGACLGNGTGTVGSSVLAGQFPYYAGTGTTLTATSSLYISPSGNIGVGTTTPLSALAVSGGESIGSGYNIAAPTNGLIVQGNVGIGTTSPSIAGGSNGLAIDGTSAILGVYSSSNDRAIILAPGGGSLDAVGTNLNINRFSGNNVSIGSSAATGDLSIGQVASNFARFYVAGTANASLPLEIFSTSTPTSTTTVAEIDQNGNALFGLGGASVGIGTTSPISRLTVVGSGCFSVGAGATATCGTTPGNIYYTNSNTGNYDVAEDYVTTNSNITPGTIVSVDPNNAEYITTATSGSTVLGVVSTAPGVTLGGADGSTKGMITKPVALSGRIPVQVNLDGGPIQIGDRIALSSTPGVGQKAVSSGETVGIALQSAYAPGTIQVFVQPQYMFSAGDLSFDGQGNVSIGAAAPSVPSTTGTTDKLTVNGSESAAGTVSASSFTVAGAGAEFAQNFSSLSFGSTTALSVLTNGGQDVDIYKLATFTLSNLQALTTQTNTISSQVQSLTARVTALEAGANAGMQAAEASSTSSSFLAASSTQLASALESFGVVIQNGIAQFNTLVTSDLSFSKSADGSSAAGSSSILAGNTTVVVQNSHMFSTSQVSVTMTSAYAGNWYVSQKQNGSFQVTLSQTQPANVTFDYFIVQTQGQIATSTPTGYVGSPFSWIATLFGGATTAQTPVTAAPAPTSNTNASTSTVTGSGATTSSSTPSASAPTVTLTGAAAISLNVNDAFIDPGATAKDASGNDISSSIVVTGSVNTAAVGMYTLTYTATDAAGNTGSASRVVTVSGAAASSSGSSSSTSSASSAPATSATTPATDTTPTPSTSSTPVAPATSAATPTTPSNPVTTASPAAPTTQSAAAPASAASSAAPASGEDSSSAPAAATSPSS